MFHGCYRRRARGPGGAGPAKTGAAAALNAGVNEARQPWVAFLSADDWWEPEKIEYQRLAAQRHADVGMVSCDLCRLDTEEHRQPARAIDTTTSISYFSRAVGDFLSAEMNYNPSTVLIRRDALLSVGLFDEDLLHNAEFECFLRVLAQWPLAVVEQPLVCCRGVWQRSLESHLTYIQVVGRMGAHSERYPLGAAQTFDASLKRVQRFVGRALLEEGRRRQARGVLSQAVRKDFEMRALLLWLATWPHPVLFQFLVRMKRRWLSALGRLRLIPRSTQPLLLEPDERSLALAVPTPQGIVDKMLHLAGVKRDEVVYGLGCGDGRILTTAVQKFGARATGVELDSRFFKIACENIDRLGFADRVRVIHGDLLTVDLTPADVVTLYLATDANRKLRPNLEKYLRPGSRVVSYDFHVAGWTPTRVEKVEHGVTVRKIYLYEIGQSGSESRDACCDYWGPRRCGRRGFELELSRPLGPPPD